MAGILPFSKVIKNNKQFVYFLFSRETLDQTSPVRGKWSDFGGSKDKDETKIQTAIREGFEESYGVFGSPTLLKQKIQKSSITFTNRSYKTHLIEVPYDPRLPKYLENFYRFIKHEKKELINKDGLFEKDKFKWIEINDLHNHLPIFRHWYREIVEKIIKNKKSFY